MGLGKTEPDEHWVTPSVFEDVTPEMEVELLSKELDYVKKELWDVRDRNKRLSELLTKLRHEKLTAVATGEEILAVLEKTHRKSIRRKEAIKSLQQAYDRNTRILMSLILDPEKRRSVGKLLEPVLETD